MLVTHDPGGALAAPGIQEWALAPPACQNRFSYGSRQSLPEGLGPLPGDAAAQRRRG